MYFALPSDQPKPRRESIAEAFVSESSAPPIGVSWLLLGELQSSPLWMQKLIVSLPFFPPSS
jgi:hypothetical protein